MNKGFLGVTLALLLSAGLSAQNASNKSGPIFEDGQAQINPAFNTPQDWIKHELWVVTDFDSDQDGKMDRMHVMVTRPPQTETEKIKLPVIYKPSPYFAGTGGGSKTYIWSVKHELGESPEPHKHPTVVRKDKRPITAFFDDRTWVPRGYIMVYSCSPGTGFSDGAPTIGGKNESLAPKAVIDWLCGRANAFTSRDGNEKVEAYWSSGKVGMIGTSYNGTLALAAATTGVDGLEAIIPIAPNTSYYHYYRSNGLVKSPGGYLGEDVDVLYDFVHSGDPEKRAANNKRVRDDIIVAGIDRASGDYNDFWKSRDYIHQLEKMKAPMLMSHGFNDWNVMPEHSYRIYEAVTKMGIPTQLYYHQRGHGGPPPMPIMNRWFTRYLHGIENGVEQDSKVYIVREGDRLPTKYASYPDANMEMLKLYPSKFGEAFGQLITEKSHMRFMPSFVDDYSIKVKKHIKAKNSDHRLLFLSPVLYEDLRISGTPRITVKLMCNKEAANLSVYLVSLPYQKGKGIKIYDNIITRSWADPQNRNSLTKGEPLKQGRFYEVQFDLMPDDQVVKKGQQIGLMIFSSDREFTLHPEKGTKLTVDVNGTSILLPVVGGVKAYEKATKRSFYPAN